MFITFVVSGLWHGAGWAYLLWGAAHGIWLVIERMVKFDRWSRHWLVRIPMCLVTFVIVALLFSLFNHDMPTAFHLMGRMATESWTDGLSVTQSVNTVSREWSMVTMFGLMMAKELRDEFRPTLLADRRWVEVVFYAAVVLLILSFGVFDRGGQFIYMHF